MPGLITKNFRFHNADQFFEAFGESAPTTTYVFIARVDAFPDEADPPTPLNSVKEVDYSVWNNMIALKRVQSTDVRFAVKRYNWANNVLYHEYQDTDTNLTANTYFVYDSDTRNVYKVLFNNNGANSTIKPTGTSTTELRTADGYIWKYMYTVDSADVDKFVTDTFIPVANNSTIQNAAVNGACQIVDVVSGGSGYRANTGTFSSVTNTTVLVLGSGASVVDGHYTNSTIFIESGDGSGQLRDIIAYRGASRTVTVNTAFSPSPSGSSTYTIGPKIRIRGDGNQQALAFANTVAGGVIRNIEVINTGNNYSFANVTITANGGSGATANVYISPIGGHGFYPQRELGGHNVILNARLAGNVSSTFVTNNDFRIVGLVNNPILRSTGAVASDLQIDQSTKLTVTDVSGDFRADEIVISNRNVKGRVIEFANTNAARTAGLLRLSHVAPNANGSRFTTGSITGNTSSVTATVANVAEPTLVQYKGEVVYLETRVKVTRAPDQTEDIKIVFKF